jgi:hypothetical protein
MMAALAPVSVAAWGAGALVPPMSPVLAARIVDLVHPPVQDFEKETQEMRSRF